MLDEPEAMIVFNGFGESSLNFVIGAWTIKQDVLKVKNELPNVGIVGRNAALPDTYGLSADDLAQLMAQWRERALARGPRR